ncbi:MAG: hypothetical protein GTO63_27650 [Anaerolineae bacterium]|nr:hypothetical protein [Anaerolineae bacterium]NIN98506.1 hypothetical protein [Anaerolineae bacterium]
MPSGNRLSGETLYLEWVDPSGTVVLDADYREFGPSEEVQLIDQSAGPDVARTYIPRLEDGAADLRMIWVDINNSPSGTLIWTRLDKASEGTLRWGEEGNTTGDPRHTVAAIVQSRDKTIPYDGEMEASFTFQFNGVPSDDVYP